MNIRPLTHRLCAAAVLALAFASASAADSVYARRNLVSDGTIPAAHTDPNLINGWGVAFNPYGFVWVASADGGVSTLYDGLGNPQPLVVQIPSPTMGIGGNPTGIVFNGSDNFVVSRNGISGPSRFIFATEQGVIAAWSPAVDLTHAIRMVNNAASGAVYKGLAIGANGSIQLLYAADFRNARIDVYNTAFHRQGLPTGAFVDPYLPPGYAPFGIQAINGDIYVTYARQNADKNEEVTGPGLGYVDVYSPNGRLIRRVASGGALNAPWGVAMAPAGFGRFSNALLIGNFGDGRINAYEPVFSLPLGTLRDKNGKSIRVDGLWGIAFGNGLNTQPVNTLFFAAGPDDEEHGLYGRIDLVH
jgi:uncharacterized protein (TIGR03118 family)